MQPELWDPVTGAMRLLTDFQRTEFETMLTLGFAPAQSCFVVFRRAPLKSQAVSNFPARTPVVTLEGAWLVTFDPKWGGPAAPVTFESLVDWTTRSESGIRYYSGTAVYRKTFDLAAISGEMFLDLGTVNHLARVKVNGRDLGVVWCAPWGVAVPKGLLKRTGNVLEIEVTNVWANRLIGDEQEPEDCVYTPGYMGGRYLKRFPDWFAKHEKRPSAGRYTFTTWNYFDKNSKPVSSGLLGPVRLMGEDWTLTQAARPVKPRAVRRVSRQAADAFEADVPAAELLVPIAAAEESGAMATTGGGNNADALFNRTTRNGAGGADTTDDGRTFRGYGAGNSLTLRVDPAKRPQGVELTEIRTFAGHGDARAGQAYSVWVATAAAPATFMRVIGAVVSCDGGASQLRVPVGMKNVVAVRLDFADGPHGFNVYREICLLGK